MRALAAAIVLCPIVAVALNAGLGEPPGDIKRDTPLEAWHGFFTEAHEGDYAYAAHFLALDHIKKASQPVEGPRLARRLKFVLDRKLRETAVHVSNDPNGDPAEPSSDVVGVIPLENGSVTIRLVRVEVPPLLHAWVFSPDTVAAIDKLYDQWGPPLGEHLPEVLFRGSLFGIEPWQWAGIFIAFILAVAVAKYAQRAILIVGRRFARLTAFAWDDELIEAGEGPLKLPFFGAVIAAMTRALLLPTPTQQFFDFIVRSLIIISVAWFLLRFLHKLADQLTGNAAADGDDGGRVRGVQTQIAVLRRVFEIAIWVIGAALLLIQFEVVRNVGVSLLASAGIAGLVVGLAAQKSIGALLAGIQLSVTQPIRIGDTVVIEGENGTIEEITLTYVVVRIWDLRRLVVPVSFFLDKSFQNWSRREPDMLGTLTVEVDFQADVEALRKELDRLLASEAKPLWDGKTAQLQVTDAKDRTMTLRVLVSAKSSGLNWDLRCLLRERILSFISRHPEWLPTARTEARAPIADSRPRQ